MIKSCLSFLLAWGASSLAGQQPAYQVEVESVLVNVLVTDDKGRPLVGLRKADFRLFEEGVEREIEAFFAVDAPFSVALVLDTSYSTMGKLHLIQYAAIEFLRQLHPDDQVAVISFEEEVYLESDFTSNRERAERGVKQTRTGRNTALYDAVYVSLEQLAAQPYRKILILFSDGLDTASGDTGLRETLEFAREADATLYSIFFDTRADALRALNQPPGLPPSGPVPMPAPNPLPVPLPVPRPAPGQQEEERRRIEHEYAGARRYLKELAEVSGGKLLEAGEDLSNLQQAFSQIAEEMRSLYSLAFTPGSAGEKERFRRIEVRVARPGAKVRARKGYLRR